MMRINSVISFWGGIGICSWLWVKHFPRQNSMYDCCGAGCFLRLSADGHWGYFICWTCKNSAEGRLYCNCESHKILFWNKSIFFHFFWFSDTQGWWYVKPEFQFPILIAEDAETHSLGTEGRDLIIRMPPQLIYACVFDVTKWNFKFL